MNKLLMLPGFGVMSIILIGMLQNNIEFALGFFWSSLLVVYLVSIPFINKYKKFSWMDKPLITSVGMTVLAQIIVTIYWGFAFDGATTTPLVERLAIDAILFYPLMFSLIPIGLGISYAAIKFTNKSKIVQGTGLVTIQLSERKSNGLLVGLVTFQVFLNVITYSFATL